MLKDSYTSTEKKLTNSKQYLKTNGWETNLFFSAGSSTEQSDSEATLQIQP